MKYKVLILFGLIFGGHCFNLYRNSELTVPEVKTYEITDKITGNTHIFYKEPKLKKSILYCLKDKENKVVWAHWHVNQTPEYTYSVDSYKNYLERNWVEQHYGYRIAP
jgi:hypothetical protein|tara:strand:- start:724 stop:1047 length:324 start_codon:yes stop_codon:yes gene_type:complete